MLDAVAPTAAPRRRRGAEPRGHVRRAAGRRSARPGASPTCFAFQAPARNAVALGDAGVDVVNLANNHAWDYGAERHGPDRHRRAAPRREVTGRPGEITLVDLPRARVAFLGSPPTAGRRPSATSWPSARSSGAPPGRPTSSSCSSTPGRRATPEPHAGPRRGGLRRAPRQPAGLRPRGRRRGRRPRPGVRPARPARMELTGAGLAYSLGNLAGCANFALRGDSVLSGLLRVRVGRGARSPPGLHAARPCPSRDPVPRRLRRRLAPGHPRRPAELRPPRRADHVVGTAARAPVDLDPMSPRGRGANGNTQTLQGWLGVRFPPPPPRPLGDRGQSRTWLGRLCPPRSTLSRGHPRQHHRTPGR